jgi:hypothetical protein
VKLGDRKKRDRNRECEYWANLLGGNIYLSYQSNLELFSEMIKERNVGEK